MLVSLYALHGDVYMVMCTWCVMHTETALVSICTDQMSKSIPIGHRASN